MDALLGVLNYDYSSKDYIVKDIPSIEHIVEEKKNSQGMLNNEHYVSHDVNTYSKCCKLVLSKKSDDIDEKLIDTLTDNMLGYFDYRVASNKLSPIEKLVMDIRKIREDISIMTYIVTRSYWVYTVAFPWMRKEKPEPIERIPNLENIKYEYIDEKIKLNKQTDVLKVLIYHFQKMFPHIFKLESSTKKQISKYLRNISNVIEDKGIIKLNNDMYIDVEHKNYIIDKYLFERDFINYNPFALINVVKCIRLPNNSKMINEIYFNIYDIYNDSSFIVFVMKTDDSNKQIIGKYILPNNGICKTIKLNHNIDDETNLEMGHDITKCKILLYSIDDKEILYEVPLTHECGIDIYDDNFIDLDNANDDEILPINLDANIPLLHVPRYISMESPYNSVDNILLNENAILLEHTPFEILNCSFKDVFDKIMQTEIYFQIHKKYNTYDYFMQLKKTDGSPIQLSPVKELLIDNNIEQCIGKFVVSGTFNISEYIIVLQNNLMDTIHESKLTSTLHYNQNDLLLDKTNSDIKISDATVLLEKYLHLPKNKYIKKSSLSRYISKAKSLIEKFGTNDTKPEPAPEQGSAPEQGILAIETTVGDSPDTKIIGVRNTTLSKDSYYWELDMTIDETETIKRLTEKYNEYKTCHIKLAFLISKYNKRIHTTTIGVKLYSVKGIINEFNYLQKNWGKRTSTRNEMIFDYLCELTKLLKK